MAALIILITIGVMVLIAVFAVRGGPPRWQLSAWQADGQGGWLRQPVLTIRDEEFRFDTPQDYLGKLRELQDVFARYPDVDTGNLDEVIQQLGRAQGLFLRRPAPPEPVASPVHNTPSRTEPAVVVDEKARPPPLPTRPPAPAGATVQPPKRNGEPERGVVVQSLGALPERVAMRTYSDRRADSGRVPFANALKALYTNNASAFPYWLDQVLGRGVEDAYSHVAAQYRVAWARSVLIHYKVCREFAVAVPAEMMGEIESGLSAIESLLSYDRLAPVRQVAVDSRFRMPGDPLGSVSYEIDEFRRDGYSGCSPEYIEERRLLVASALLNGRLETLLNWTVPILLCDPGTEKDLELPLADLAGWLAILSAMHKRDASALAKRFADTAKLCASRANTAAMDYPNMIPSFKTAGLPIPASSPQGQASEGWRISLEGELFPNVPGASPMSAGATAPSSEREVLRAIEKSLLGLVGLDGLKPLLAMDVFEFLSTRQSRGRVFWGSSGVGKTELAQRLAGLREGFPRLSIGGGEVRYVSGVDGKLEVKDLIDALPPLSILFIDEADKCLDPKAGMVNAAEATQIRHAIITHFQRKPVLWVFLGVFAQMRSDGQLTDDALRVTFGDELAHRLDYADWGFPAWTLENLLKAVNGGTSRRKLQYQDEAALVLAQYCIKSGGGVRAFDNLETAILRHLRVTGQPPDTKVSLGVAREILAKRGVQVQSVA